MLNNNNYDYYYLSHQPANLGFASSANVGACHSSLLPSYPAQTAHPETAIGSFLDPGSWHQAPAEEAEWSVVIDTNLDLTTD
jgi:hypothetical protein